MRVSCHDSRWVVAGVAASSKGGTTLLVLICQVWKDQMMGSAARIKMGRVRTGTARRVVGLGDEIGRENFADKAWFWFRPFGLFRFTEPQFLCAALLKLLLPRKE